MPGGTHLGPDELPRDISFQNSVMSGLMLVVLIMIAKHPLSMIIRRL